jgi:NAD(P)-dependent dehydrogenase (short-subunit alcohol dehydrogenase family)
MRDLGRRDFIGTVAAAAAVVGVACRSKSEWPADRDGVARVPRDPRALEGKICLVTGATSGMGKVAALELARLGATVIVAGRDPESCSEHAAAIRRETGVRVETALADLAVRDQVRRMASEVAGRFERLDVLVNNAATVLFERTLTVDGLERTFAVNYLSHFLLTNLLLDRLKSSPSARIVNVSSSEHLAGEIDFANLQGERHYERLDAYARSKLAILMFSYELARRLRGSRITVNAVHPGTVRSNLGDDNGFLRGWLWVRARKLWRWSSWLSPEDGARSIVYVASSPDLEGVSGRYFNQWRDESSSPRSYDEAVAKRLWDVSAELCGLSRENVAFPEPVPERPRAVRTERP